MDFFSVDAMKGLHLRFSKSEKLQLWKESDFSNDSNLNIQDVMPFKSDRDYCSQFTSRVNGVNSIIKYIDIPHGVQKQQDILTYLSILKTYHNNHLELMHHAAYVASNDRGSFAKVYFYFLFLLTTDSTIQINELIDQLYFIRWS